MSAQLQNFTPVVSLMETIKASGAAWPRVRLDMAGLPLVLTVAGDRARAPGSVNLTDGRRYPENVFYGRITRAGEFQPASAARALDPVFKSVLWQMLTRMRDGEAEEVFAENGKRLGICAICGRPLSDQDSVARGIGPVCAERAFG